MKNFTLKCLTVFVGAMIGDIIIALYVKSIIDNSTILAVLSVVVLTYLTFLGTFFFTEESTNKRKLAITTASAFGAGIGTLIVMLAFKDLK